MSVRVVRLLAGHTFQGAAANTRFDQKRRECSTWSAVRASGMRLLSDLGSGAYQLPITNHHSALLYQPKIQANISGATIVASDSIIYLGVSRDSLPQVIFSFGTAPE
jgi:hypothetical protein